MSNRSTVVGLVGRIFARISGIIKNDLNLAALRRKYGADGSTVIEIQIYEDQSLHRPIYTQRYKVGQQTVETVTDRPPNATTLMSYGTLINLVRGKATRVAPNGEKFVEPYDFMDAYGDGDVIIVRENVSDNERYLADIKLFQDLYKIILPRIQEMLGER